MPALFLDLADWWQLPEFLRELGRSTGQLHSEQCGLNPDLTCDTCASLLGKYPRSQWPRQERRRRRALRGLPEPLTDDFCHRLAVELADRPELYGAIVRYLAGYEGRT